MSITLGKYLIIVFGWNAFGNFSFNLLRKRWHWLPTSNPENMPLKNPTVTKHRLSWFNVMLTWETPL